MKGFLRKLHRWLGLLMALQIIAWMASGLWFSLFPITEIRGEHLTRAPEALALAPGDAQQAGLAAPSAVARALEDHLGAPFTVDELRLVRDQGQFHWRVSGETRSGRFLRLVSADGARVAPRLTEAQAIERAQVWLRQPGRIEAAEWVERTGPDSEIRGRDLPVWGIRYSEPESLHLYLDPWTGEVLARRTERWRIFDFLWMLHIMDFETRDDFNHPLLQFAALAGLVISVSGVLLWAWTSRVFRRRRRVA